MQGYAVLHGMENLSVSWCVWGKRAFRTLASFVGHTESFCAADLFKNPIISLDLLWNDYVRAMYYYILQ